MPYILDPCMICLCQVCEPIALDCGHIFDHECVERLLEVSDRCPLCRHRILRKTRLFMRLSTHPYPPNPWMVGILRHRDVNVFAAQNLNLKNRIKQLESGFRRVFSQNGSLHIHAEEEPRASFMQRLAPLGSVVSENQPRLLVVTVLLTLSIAFHPSHCSHLPL